MVWSFLLFVLFSFAFVVVVIVGLIRKVKYVLPIFIFVLLIIAVSETLKTETFKSPKVLEAVLKDDLSVVNLTLRQNSTFEVSVVTLFNEEKFEGAYKYINDKIIFLDKPYSNAFIPDTVTIKNDKIILKFDSTGAPVVGFASYFTIKQNLLKNGL